MFDIEKIKEKAKNNFEKAWKESVKYIPKNTKIELTKVGKPHPNRTMMQRFRRILLNSGFDEMENRTILPEEDVYKEYGPEAPVILDRTFYLAKLPRPDIGLSKLKIKKIEEIIGKTNPEKIKKILRDYKKGEIEGDDFVEELTNNLKIKQEHATRMIDEVFPEFKELKPEPTNQTLRSHMTAGWYYTLSAIQDRGDFPLALFAVGPRYRNEQKEDKGHLRVHHSASIVILDPGVSLEAGREITKKILNDFGFKEVNFEKKKATSKYYAKGLEEEVFVKHKGEWLEIADIGMYSVISLANFGIKYPVFNAGFGVERMEMVFGAHEDIRELTYPQFYSKGFSDKEIAELIRPTFEPQTEEGRKIAKVIEETAFKNKDKNSPVEVLAYENKKFTVKIVEKEEGKKLIGPAGFNKIFVKDGNIQSGMKLEGEDTGLTYISAIAKRFASEIETLKNDMNFKRKIVKSLSNINLDIPNELSSFIQSNKKKINISGPVFLEVEVKFK